MRTPAQKRALLISLLVAVAIAAVAFALPWAEPFRRSIRSQLLMFVLVVAGVSAVAELALGTVHVISKRNGWRSAGIQLSLGASALSLALAFLPGAPGSTPHLYPILGAALFAVAAAVQLRRSNTQSE